ncbi:hypothetical protein FB451DRAFT_1568009 [Mycena latifolia]|nr:hypothetical protein FB451DRAFT_1568009 [Mycena latifolia]
MNGTQAMDAEQLPDAGCSQNTTNGDVKQRLHIVIVGCGIGGLSAAYCLGRAGHMVTVLERASEITDVGAGIQVGPNLSRLLMRWGLAEQLKKIATKPQAITFLRYSTGERIGWTKWGKAMEDDHGAPYYHVHRADLLAMLHAHATPYMTLRLGCKVVAVDAPGARVTLASGETVSGDLIVGADGLKSAVRAAVVGASPPPIHTGAAAYRALVPTAAMLADPDLRALVEAGEMSSWMGPEKHIIGYCIRGKTEYNLVLVHPAPGSTTESYMAEGSVAQMRADFAGWEPRVEKLLRLVEKTYVLPLMYREPLDSWVHPAGTVVLLGDAAHPTLPSRAQGSAMAVEDAAVLGTLLHTLPPRDALRGYEALRHARTAETQRAARANFAVFHLPDGPAQQARDDSMRAAMQQAESGAAGAGGANVWADRAKSAAQFGYDAEREAERWCAEHAVTAE